MRVRIKDIPSEGRNVRQEFDRDWVDNALDGAARGGDHGGVLTVRVEMVGDKILVRGRCEAAVRLECSRCADNVGRTFAFDLTHVLEPKAGEASLEEDLELGIDDLDVSYIEGDEFELDEILREQLLLALPMIPLCREDCAGLCAQCGTNLNETGCECTPPVDPRWSALEDIKLPS